MIEGMIHLLGVGEGNFLVVFTSAHGTGAHRVSSREAAEHFIAQTLGCNLKPGEIDALIGGQPNSIKAQISGDQYRDYFSD